MNRWMAHLLVAGCMVKAGQAYRKRGSLGWLCAAAVAAAANKKDDDVFVLVLFLVVSQLCEDDD